MHRHAAVTLALFVSAALAQPVDVEAPGTSYVWSGLPESGPCVFHAFAYNEAGVGSAMSNAASKDMAGSGGTATLSWTNPTTNTDGSPLTDLDFVRLSSGCIELPGDPVSPPTIAYAPGGIVASDDFSVTENPLGSPWATTGAWPAIQASGGVAIPTSGDDDNAMFYSTSSETYSRVILGDPGGGDVGPCIEMESADENGYFLTNNDGTNIRLYRLDDGAFSQLDTASGTFGAGDTLELFRDGNDVVGEHNGTEVVRATSVTHTGGRPGMLIFDADAEVDFWSDQPESGADHTASGTPALPVPSAAGAGALGRSGSGTPALPFPTAAGAARVGRGAEGAPEIGAATAAGAAARTLKADGAPSAPAPTSTGSAARTVKGTGTPAIAIAIAAGTASVGDVNRASGAPVLAVPTASGVAARTPAAAGAPQMPLPTAAGVARLTVKAADGAPVIAIPLSAGAATVGDEPPPAPPQKLGDPSTKKTRPHGWEPFDLDYFRYKYAAAQQREEATREVELSPELVADYQIRIESEQASIDEDIAELAAAIERFDALAPAQAEQIELLEAHVAEIADTLELAQRARRRRQEELVALLAVIELLY